jgi:hypothetical protein
MIVFTLFLGVAVSLNWQPIDKHVARWGDVPQLKPGPSAVLDLVQDRTTEQWEVMPYWRPYELVQLPYCLVRNVKHQVMLDLVQTAFDAWNQYVSHDALLGLNLSFTGYCVDPRAPMMITLGKPAEDTPGVTIREFTAYGRVISSRVHIDVRLTQSAATFYNILLHEIGHVIGCDHPRVQSGVFRAATSVMAGRIMISGNRLVQEAQYAFARLGDAECIRRLYLRDFPGVIVPDPYRVVPIVPVYPAHKHVSGQWARKCL